MSETRPNQALRWIGGTLWALAVIAYLMMAFHDRFAGEEFVFYFFWLAVVAGSVLVLVGWFWGRSKPT
jgi:hypothetical protein